jgi:hypothetical protein
MSGAKGLGSNRSFIFSLLFFAFRSLLRTGKGRILCSADQLLNLKRLRPTVVIAYLLSEFRNFRSVQTSRSRMYVIQSTSGHPRGNHAASQR